MSSPSPAPVRRIHVYGHVSASPQALASTFGGIVTDSPEAESDLAIFAINPSAGIDQATIDNWAALDDFQIPRIVLVNGLDGHELDFEDAVMVANRVFDQLVTPYLVLHGDSGEPAALIRLQDLQIIDYSTQPPTLRPSEVEHEELVREFREEYLEQTAEMDEGAFGAGILFPAIPVNLEKGIGVDIVRGYIESLPSGS
jgi:translation elongation factor EF-G